MKNLSRERVKFFVVSEDNWFLKRCGTEEVEKVRQIEDADSFYSLYDAVNLYRKCVSLGVTCRVIKYSIKYKPLEEVEVVFKS